MSVPDSRPTIDAAFSPVENEAPLRWLRRLHLAPDDGLGAGRRALALALLTWLPIAAWALATGRLGSPDDSGESLLRHYGVHVRCLVAIPLLILIEKLPGAFALVSMALSAMLASR